MKSNLDSNPVLSLAKLSVKKSKKFLPLPYGGTQVVVA